MLIIKFKKKIIFMFFKIFIVLLLFISMLVIFSPIPLKYRFYLGGRITGTFKMIVNGEEYTPVEGILKYEDDENQKLQVEATEFSIKGGAYGLYKISFLLDNNDLYNLTGDTLFKSDSTNPLLTYEYINTNWWHVTKMTLTAELVLIKGEWILNTKVLYSEPLENGTISEKTIEKSFTYDEIVKGKAIILFGV